MIDEELILHDEILIPTSSFNRRDFLKTFTKGSIATYCVLKLGTGIASIVDPLYKSTLQSFEPAFGEQYINKNLTGGPNSPDGVTHTYTVTMDEENTKPDPSVPFAPNHYGIDFNVRETENPMVYELDMTVTPDGQVASENIEILINAIPTSVNNNKAPNLEASLASVNPFSDEVRVRYSLKEAETVDIEVYSLSGQKVETIYSGKQQPGIEHKATWNADYANPGMYNIRLTTPSTVNNLKVIKQ